MCFLVMSLISHDYIKVEIDKLKWKKTDQSISNVLTYLQVYSIHTVPA